jgi:hypothetical protein
MTVLQELLKHYDNLPDYEKSSESYDIMDLVNFLLEKEKQQIIDAFETGTNSYPIATYSTGEDYYNSNYN